jgi:hypothetical protein
MGVFLCKTVDSGMKYFGYAYCNMITNANSLYCNDMCVREMMVNIAVGGWKNYCTGMNT